MYIHDWEVWQEQWYKAKERREKDNKRKSESRKKNQNAEGASEESPQECPMECPADINEDVPNEEQGEKATPTNIAYTPTFEEFWEEYPRKIGKGEAYKKYKARRNDGFSDAELLLAAKNYALQCKKAKTDKQYIKHPKTFLSDATPFVDYLPKPTAHEQESLPDSDSNPFGEWKEF
jgi:hypothetical protein